MDIRHAFAIWCSAESGIGTRDLLEDDDSALEAQLHAVGESATSNLVPRDVIERVIGRRSWDQVWVDEYIESLREDLETAPY